MSIKSPTISQQHAALCHSDGSECKDGCDVAACHGGQQALYDLFHTYHLALTARVEELENALENALDWLNNDSLADCESDMELFDERATFKARTRALLAKRED